MSHLKDLTGQKFGRLTVLWRAENYKTAACWACVCECGTSKVIQGYSLRKGMTLSCGCLQREYAVATNAAARAVAAANRVKPAAEISYRSAHRRAEAAKGLASSHLCIDCGNQAQEWSLRRDAAETHMGRNGNATCLYSGNPEDYEPRCKLCHAAYDRE